MSHPSKPVLSDWQRAMAAGIAAAHPITPAVPVRARGVHLAADNDEPEPEPCSSCIGTGIGNPHVEGSRCSACNGRGYIRQSPAPNDEDPWAWNHFEPEPGDEPEPDLGPVVRSESKAERFHRLNDRRALLLQVRDMDCGVL